MFEIVFVNGIMTQFLKKSRLRRAEKSTKHILNSIYKEFKSRVNQARAAAEHKLRYGCPYQEHSVHPKYSPNNL